MNPAYIAEMFATGISETAKLGIIMMICFVVTWTVLVVMIVIHADDLHGIHKRLDKLLKRKKNEKAK